MKKKEEKHFMDVKHKIIHIVTTDFSQIAHSAKPGKNDGNRTTSVTLLVFFM